MVARKVIAVAPHAADSAPDITCSRITASRQRNVRQIWRRRQKLTYSPRRAMENISDADFWKDWLTIDNETGRWDMSQLVSKMTGNFHGAPRTIANALATVILTSNCGSLLAIGWRDRRTRFTANLRIFRQSPTGSFSHRMRCRIRCESTFSLAGSTVWRISRVGLLAPVVVTSVLNRDGVRYRHFCVGSTCDRGGQPPHRDESESVERADRRLCPAGQRPAGAAGRQRRGHVDPERHCHSAGILAER